MHPPAPENGSPLKLLKTIVDIGVRPEYSASLVKSIRLANLLALFHVVFVSLYIPVFIGLQHAIGRVYAGINLVEACLFTGTWILNARRLHFWASLWFVSVGTLLIVLASYVFGNDTSVYYYLLTGAITPLVVLGYRHRYAAATAAAFCLAMFVVFDISGRPLPLFGGAFAADIVLAFKRINTTGVFVLIFAFAYYSSREAARAETSLQALNEELEARVAARTRELAERDAQLHHAQKMEAIGQLAGGIAHDFNNTLAVMRGYSELLLRKLPEDFPRRRDVEEILRASEHAEALTRQLLTIARRDAIESEVLDLHELLDEVRRFLERVISEDIVIEFALTAETVHVRADRKRLSHMLLNLAVNAKDAMPDGGTLTISTATASAPPPELADATSPCVVVSVRDTGVGMPEDVRQRIFEPFFTTKPERGTGLGLALVYGTAREFGGVVTVDSAPGRGTTFHVYLPLTDAPLSRPSPREADATPVDAPGTIMLVEDDADVRRVLREMLESLGYAVIVADHPRAAAELWPECRDVIDGLITDVVMPGSSGKHLADTLRGERPNLPVLFISGYTDHQFRPQEWDDATMRILEKPVSIGNLAQALRGLLGRA